MSRTVELWCGVCGRRTRRVFDRADWAICPHCGVDVGDSRKENGVEHEVLQAMAQIRGYVLDHYGENSRSGRIGLGTFALLAQLEGQILSEMEAEYGAAPVSVPKVR